MSLPSPREIREKPWKYIGYRGFSEFLDSDDDFFILRRFGQLSARVLLALQHEIVQLEAELSNLESQFQKVESRDVHNGSFDQDALPNRLNIIKQIHLKLKDYNELASQHAAMRARGKVPKRDINSISNWIHNRPHAILDEEAAYIKMEQDLFPMVPRAKTPLRQFFERSSKFRYWSLWSKPPPSIQHGLADDIKYMSDKRIDRFVALTITMIGMAMLVAPLWILAFVERTTFRLGVITAFVVVFLCLVSFTTVARPFESLGAAAAYSAVLVVFLQAAG